MKGFMKDSSLAFAAGCIGGLANSICLWLFGTYGITGAAGVQLAPALTPAWLYPRIVWGGIWGLTFLLPMLKNAPMRKGLILSIGPTVVQVLVVFPYRLNKGMFGLDLGVLTPLFVVVLNAVWGVTAAVWLWWSERG